MLPSEFLTTLRAAGQAPARPSGLVSVRVRLPTLAPLLIVTGAVTRLPLRSVVAPMLISALRLTTAPFWNALPSTSIVVLSPRTR